MLRLFLLFCFSQISLCLLTIVTFCQTNLFFVFPHTIFHIPSLCDKIMQGLILSYKALMIIAPGISRFLLPHWSAARVFFNSSVIQSSENKREPVLVR
jgi:hypothetical protein